jgi:hypothetical protein
VNEPEQGYTIDACCANKRERRQPQNGVSNMARREARATARRQFTQKTACRIFW